ncbi:MAG TPA: SDR family oxidoreductase [Terriglobales bacterium]|jgi:NAD(P)-dependent dehydrogenase (short-subunit alcohol dehydrogenase family)
MNNVIKKTAVITGASSGIGESCVTQMLHAGWHVFATVRKAEDAERLRSQNRAGLTPVLLDVQERFTVITAAQQVASQLEGRGLDGLVNVAGIGMARPVEYATQEDLREIFDVNVFGQIAVTQAFLPLIREARGRIVNITSVGVHIAIPFGGLLNASKSAFSLLSDTLRLELHPFGIHVCNVEPGAIKTPAVKKTLGNIEKVISDLPEKGAARYGSMLKSFARHAYAREMHGSSPDVVAHAVLHALTARKPRSRYQAGKDARLFATLSGILPDRILDAIRFKNLGLPSRFGALG